MYFAASFVAVLSLAAIVTAGGHFDSFGGGDFGGQGGDVGSEGGFGGEGFGAGNAGGESGGEHHDFKGFATSYVHVHKPKTFTVPVFKYVFHDEKHHHEGGGDEGGFGGGFGGGQGGHHF